MSRAVDTRPYTEIDQPNKSVNLLLILKTLNGSSAVEHPFRLVTLIKIMVVKPPVIEITICTVRAIRSNTTVLGHPVTEVKLLGVTAVGHPYIQGTSSNITND
jgi:hypothetical protein